jgi:hypothetical protein
MNETVLGDDLQVPPTKAIELCNEVQVSAHDRERKYHTYSDSQCRVCVFSLPATSQLAEPDIKRGRRRN